MIKQPLPAHCIQLVGDAFDETLLDGPLGEHAPYDVVLSDMAPNTMGDKTTDQIRSFDAFMRAVTLAEQLLAPGGSFAGKIFMSGYFPEARDNLRKSFDKVRRELRGLPRRHRQKSPRGLTPSAQRGRARARIHG